MLEGGQLQEDASTVSGVTDLCRRDREGGRRAGRQLDYLCVDMFVYGATCVQGRVCVAGALMREQCVKNAQTVEPTPSSACPS